MQMDGISPENGQQFTPESVDAILEDILRESEEVGHGQDGVIFKVDLRLLSRAHYELLVANGILVKKEEEEVAVKILKVYNPGTGDHEFRMQKQAREILRNKENVAQIPDATVTRDQHIDKDMQDLMKSYGAHLNDRAEMVVMDYIDGKDLGVLMYEFVLRKIGYDDTHISSLSQHQKEQIVGQELGFEIPNLKSANSHEELRSARAITHNRNEEKLFKYLKKNGMKFDPAIFDKIDNAIKILNQNGIYHNDLHKGNVMVDTAGEVYIIDFGRSDSEKTEDGISDGNLSQKWRKLSVSQEEEERQIHDEELAQVKGVEARMRSNPLQADRINLFIRTFQAKGIPSLEAELSRGRGSDSAFEQFFVMLHLLSEAPDVNKDMVNTFIKSLGDKDRGFRPYEANKIRMLQKIGYLG